jgi:hypothetical protein
MRPRSQKSSIKYPYDVAARAFRETLERLELPASDPVLENPERLGREAAMAAAAGAIWRKHLGPTLGTAEVQEKIGVRTRQAVSDLVKRRRLLALDTEKAGLRYPLFQFSPQGRPYPEIPQILEMFHEANIDPYTAASWFKTPQALLKNKTPAAWLQADRDPALVVEAARRVADTVGH